MKIGIVGYGTVGETIAVTLNRKDSDIKLMVYDKFKKHSIWSVSLDDLVNKSDVVFICLPTPIKDLTTGEPNLSIIEAELFNINKAMAGPRCNNLPVVVKSTILPGTCKDFSQISNNIDLYFTPEFLTEKNRFNDIEDNLAIIGTDKWQEKSTYENNRLVAQILQILHGKPNSSDCKLKFTSWEEAELIKYMHNCFLALKVAFAADFYKICEKLSADYDLVKDLAILGSRGRIADSHLNQPANDGKLSYISSCFTKDILAGIYLFKKLNLEPFTIESAHRNMMNYRGIDEALKKWGKTIYDTEDVKKAKI